MVSGTGLTPAMVKPMKNAALVPPLALLGQTYGLAVGANKIELAANELAGVSDLRHADEGAAHSHDLSPSSRVRNLQVEHRAALDMLELEAGRF